MNITTSMEEKMLQASRLAVALAYEDCEAGIVRDTTTLFGQETSDRVWAWVDGLVQKYHLSRIMGRCSLQASLDYDIAKAEESIDADIMKFQVMATLHAIPVDSILM